MSSSQSWNKKKNLCSSESSVLSQPKLSCKFYNVHWSLKKKSRNRSLSERGLIESENPVLLPLNPVWSLFDLSLISVCSSTSGGRLCGNQQKRGLCTGCEHADGPSHHPGWPRPARSGRNREIWAYSPDALQWNSGRAGESHYLYQRLHFRLWVFLKIFPNKMVIKTHTHIRNFHAWNSSNCTFLNSGLTSVFAYLLCQFYWMSAACNPFT